MPGTHAGVLLFVCPAKVTPVQILMWLAYLACSSLSVITWTVVIAAVLSLVYDLTHQPAPQKTLMRSVPLRNRQAYGNWEDLP